MRGFLVGSLWILLYLFFCLIPLGLAVGQPDAPGRTFLIDFSVALGFVGLSILALQFALVARFKVVAAPFGIDALLRYHKQISYVALAFVVAHPVLLFIADTEYLKLLNLWTAPWRARFAVTSVVLLLVLIALVGLATAPAAQLRTMAGNPRPDRRARGALRPAAREPGRLLRHRRRAPGRLRRLHRDSRLPAGLGPVDQSLPDGCVGPGGSCGSMSSPATRAPW